MRPNKNKENLVIIFAKKPEPGKVKTRIARETSEEFAYEFAKICLIELLNKIRNSNYYDLVVAVDSLNDLMWFQKEFSLEGIVIGNKRGKNYQEILSNMFENIFTQALAKNALNYKKCILIPMDVPFINEEELISAFARLDHHQFVIGPEVNGGVYLIGIKSPYRKGIFKGIRWSTSHSFEDLLKNFGKENTFCLKLKSDLNFPEDLLRLKNEIYYNCPLLYDFLKKSNFYFSVKNKYINFDDLSICIPVVSNIVQKKEKGEIKILIQTRYKPTLDPENTGKLEIPSGLIKKYELAQEAAIRETKEETGILSEISEEQEVVGYSIQRNGEVVAIYRPFCCVQQLKGGRAYLCIGFISNYGGGKLTESFRENRNPRWISLKKLKKIVDKKPERIFSLSLAILKEYIKYKEKIS